MLFGTITLYSRTKSLENGLYSLDLACLKCGTVSPRAGGRAKARLTQRQTTLAVQCVDRANCENDESAHHHCDCGDPVPGVERLHPLQQVLAKLYNTTNQLKTGKIMMQGFGNFSNFYRLNTNPGTRKLSQQGVISEVICQLWEFLKKKTHTIKRRPTVFKKVDQDKNI